MWERQHEVWLVTQVEWCRASRIGRDIAQELLVVHEDDKAGNPRDGLQYLLHGHVPEVLYCEGEGGVCGEEGQVDPGGVLTHNELDDLDICLPNKGLIHDGPLQAGGVVYPFNSREVPPGIPDNRGSGVRVLRRKPTKYNGPRCVCDNDLSLPDKRGVGMEGDYGEPGDWPAEDAWHDGWAGGPLRYGLSCTHGGIHRSEVGVELDRSRPALCATRGPSPGPLPQGVLYL